MSIGIYHIDPGQEPVLIVVAPLENRDQVELYVARLNKQSEDAGYSRRYKISATNVLIMKF